MDPYSFYFKPFITVFVVHPVFLTLTNQFCLLESTLVALELGLQLSFLFTATAFNTNSSATDSFLFSLLRLVAEVGRFLSEGQVTMGGGDINASKEAASKDVGDAVTVSINCSSGSKFSVQANLDSTVDSFKALLARNCGVPADQQRLIYKGRILKDDQTLRSYEIIDRNPELAHILNAPSVLRQTFEAARNPELMREVIRNTDRAMSNIESSPEGFNMLRRMYETVQEPLLNATTMTGTTGNGGSNPFSSLLGTQGGNQARDGSTNQPTSDSGTTPNANPLPNPCYLGFSSVDLLSEDPGGSQTNTRRSDPGADARPQAPAGLGGLGLPAFEGLFGAMQDSNSLNQLMQNPAISQMMRSLLSSPQYLNEWQVLSLSPQLQNMLGSNSQPREMMQNSQFLRQLTSPEMMQQLLTLQQTLFSQLSRPQSTQEPAQTGGGAGTLNMGLEAMMTMFSGLGTGSLGVPNRSDVPPEQLYATQLSQLQEMGFIDTRENIQALIASAGNVHAAVERLLGNPGPFSLKEVRQ
ncbi:hypothetical protein GOBAR_AA38516 [Gossypium barbadense]|uniref:Ubiquitin-like domain-containing protein n=1 Tax=Gossypium barbadense TaxID=3634 RepID=A0A2P5VTM5_GOSBA|nr:hypothetical protein GOBAR_AA38516 [Gossypium barbadense]